MVPVAPLAQKKSGEIKTRSPTENFLDTQFSRMAFCFNRATDLLRNLAKQNRETVLARLQASCLSTPDLSGNRKSGS